MGHRIEILFYLFNHIHVLHLWSSSMIFYWWLWYLVTISWHSSWSWGKPQSGNWQNGIQTWETTLPLNHSSIFLISSKYRTLLCTLFWNNGFDILKYWYFVMIILHYWYLASIEWNLNIPNFSKNFTKTSKLSLATTSTSPSQTEGHACFLLM